MHARNDVASGASWRAGEPLWRSLPTQDESGKPLSDFMMLAPGLKNRSAAEVEAVLNAIRDVLEKFPDVVVFANFNLVLNLLWVSLRCRQGAMSVLVAALRTKVPMLKLVGHNPIDRG
jgi:hypothetical protein